MGDEQHPTGEEHVLLSWEVERTQKEGIKLKISEDNWGDVYYHLYPCAIRKVVYKLEPIEITTIEGGDRTNCDCWRGKIGMDKDDAPYDWKEHWP